MQVGAVVGLVSPGCSGCAHLVNALLFRPGGGHAGAGPACAGECSKGCVSPCWCTLGCRGGGGAQVWLGWKALPLALHICPQFGSLGGLCHSTDEEVEARGFVHEALMMATLCPGNCPGVGVGTPVAGRSEHLLASCPIPQWQPLLHDLLVLHPPGRPRAMESRAPLPGSGVMPHPARRGGPHSRSWPQKASCALLTQGSAQPLLGTPTQMHP